MATNQGPTTELGIPDPYVTGGIGGITPWAALIDDREYAPDLVWPNSITVYSRMETDAQLNGLLLGCFLPIRRMLWQLDKQSASAEVVNALAEDLGLGIRGRKNQPTRPRRRGRFSHDRHLAHALRSLALGHYFFEQVGELDTEERWRLRKLATRPPRTLSTIQIARNGDLVGIQQFGTPSVQPIPESRLVAYVWNSQDDGDWLGRSMLRPCYRNWLVKDRLIRVDATKHERNGMGIPWFEADPAATDEQIKELAATAARWRAGEEAGGAGPGKLHLKGIEGMVPDTVASLEWHDKQMSRSFLQTFVELAAASTGSRSLADSMIDFFADAQQAIADWYADTFTQHVIEDWVEWNYGPDEPAPALVWMREQAEDISMHDLAALAKEGVIQTDDDLEDAIREGAHLPLRKTPRAAVGPPTPPGEANPVGDTNVADPSADGSGDGTVAVTDHTRSAPTASRPRSHLRDAMAEKIVAEVQRDPGRDWATVTRSIDVDPKNGTARRARDELLDAGRIKFGPDGLTAGNGTTAFRRELYDHEVAAGTDFDVIAATRSDTVETLIADVKAAQLGQVDAVEAAIAGADGDLTELAHIGVEPIDSEVIARHLEAAAAFGEREAEREAKSQGVKAVRAAADPIKADVTTQLEDRAKAIALLLAGSLSDVASRQAVQRTSTGASSKTASQVAAEVKDYIGGLTDTFLADQANGAVMAAMNTGRREFMRANGPKNVYASELMDENTCSPCADEDGTEWPTVEAAEEDYPAGGYIGCDGDLRCRGTIVAIY